MESCLDVIWLYLSDPDMKVTSSALWIIGDIIHRAVTLWERAICLRNSFFVDANIYSFIADQFGFSVRIDWDFRIFYFTGKCFSSTMTMIKVAIEIFVAIVKLNKIELKTSNKSLWYMSFSDEYKTAMFVWGFKSQSHRNEYLLSVPLWT